MVNHFMAMFIRHNVEAVLTGHWLTAVPHRIIIIQRRAKVIMLRHLEKMVAQSAKLTVIGTDVETN